MVRTNTLAVPGASDAAVVRIKDTKRALALATDGNGRWCQLNPRLGAMHAVAEAARNVACSGATPHRRHQLPEFRQPRKARSDVAIQRSHRRPDRRLHRTRNPHHRRQRQFLQRNARRFDLSHAGHRHSRRHRRRRQCFEIRLPQLRRHHHFAGWLERPPRQQPRT